MLQFGVLAITVLAKLQPVCKETEVWLSSGGGGGGGVLFSSLDGIFGEFSSIHSPPAFFFFFFKVETISCTLIPLFRSGSVHSGSAS